MLLYTVCRLTHYIHIGISNTPNGSLLDILGDVEFAESHETRHHVLVGELQDPERISLFDGGVVCVQVFQECQEVLRCCIVNDNLQRDTSRKTMVNLGEMIILLPSK